MSQSRGHQRGELFRWVHLPSVERRNQDGNQEESEGIQISSDALSEGPIEAHATFLPRDQSITQSKRKASDVSANENHAAKKTKKSPKNKTWTADQVELLLRYVKDFKTKYDFNGIDHAIFSRKFTPGPRGDKIACKGELFFDHGWAGYLTYPGSPTSM